MKVDQGMCKELHQDGSTSSRDEEGRAQDAPSLEDLMLEACHPRAHGMMKTSSKKRFPHGVWGSILQVFIKQERARANKKGVPTIEEQDGLHQVQVGCSRQRYVLDRASLLPVSCC